MHSIDCVDASFDKTNYSNYMLSIQVGLNGLSFCILDKLANKFIAIKHYPIQEDLLKEDFYKKINEILNDDKELSGEFDTVKFIYATDKCTLIPSTFFNPDNLKKYFEFNQKMDDLDEIHFDEIKEINGHNIYTVPNQVAIEISRKFPNAKFFHHATPFIRYHLTKSTSLIGFKVFIQVNHDFFDICILKDRKLLLYNTFRFHNPDDLVFFVSYVLNQLDLPFENVDVILQGNVIEIDTYRNILSEYIRNLKILDLPAGFAYCNAVKKDHPEYFINLFNLVHCE